MLVMVMGREPPILTSNIGKITALPMFSNVPAACYINTVCHVIQVGMLTGLDFSRGPEK